MSVEKAGLFTEDGLAVLDNMAFDPYAKSRYEHFSGGLIWPDEFPRPGSEDLATVNDDRGLTRLLIAARASLTRDGAEPRFLEVWTQVVERAPNWPGLRLERRSSRARHRLLAVERFLDRWYDRCHEAMG